MQARRAASRIGLHRLTVGRSISHGDPAVARTMVRLAPSASGSFHKFAGGARLFGDQDPTWSVPQEGNSRRRGGCDTITEVRRGCCDDPLKPQHPTIDGDAMLRRGVACNLHDRPVDYVPFDDIREPSRTTGHASVQAPVLSTRTEMGS